MTDTPMPSARRAAIVLVMTGLLTVALSFVRWASCSTTPCGGSLQSISEYSGIDLGFGVVTAVAGIALAAIGLDYLRRRHAHRLATVAGLIALLIVVTAGASIIWMHVLPGDGVGDGEGEGFYAPLGTALLIEKDFYWQPLTAVAVGSVGLIAFAASRSMGRARLRRP